LQSVSGNAPASTSICSYDALEKAYAWRACSRSPVEIADARTRTLAPSSFASTRKLATPARTASCFDTDDGAADDEFEDKPLARAPPPSTAAALDMLLHCPVCGTVDRRTTTKGRVIERSSDVKLTRDMTASAHLYELPISLLPSLVPVGLGPAFWPTSPALHPAPQGLPPAAVVVLSRALLGIFPCVDLLVPMSGE
jgi:hypothetical protein